MCAENNVRVGQLQMGGANALKISDVCVTTILMGLCGRKRPPSLRRLPTGSLAYRKLFAQHQRLAQWLLPSLSRSLVFANREFLAGLQLYRVIEITRVWLT